MKIAVYHNLPSGGAKRAFFEYLKRLKKRHLIDLYTLNISNEKFLPLEKIINNKFIYEVKQDKNIFSYLKLIYYQLPLIHKKIAQDINKKNYDIVLVTHDFLTKCPYLVKFLAKPCIYLCHETMREFYEPIFWHISTFPHLLVNLLRLPLKIIDYINVRRVKLVVTTSKFSKNFLEKIYNKKIFLIRAGVDYKKFIYKREKRKKILLSVGALVRLKGFDFLIRSLSFIPKKLRPTLLLVGNGGNNEKYFRLLAKRKGIKLLIKKNISDKELIDIYNKAYLLVYAPLREPLGLVTLEAMACGLPVIGVKEGGIVETLDNMGFLVERDEKKYSKIIYKLINNSTLIETMRSKVRSYVIKNWSWDKGSKQLEKYITNLSLNLKNGKD